MQVTDANALNVLGDQETPTVVFDATTNTLTFTNVPWNSFNSSYPFIQTSMDLTIHLVGISQPDMGNVLIQRMDGDNETHTLTFTTDPDNPGMFLVRGGSLSHEGFTVVYENGLAENPSGYYAEAGGNYPYAWIAQTFLGGAGTSESPYLIKSAADLKLFSDHFNEGAIDASASVQLYNDINCEEMEDFAPIGDYNNSFAGTFDGNNKVISNLTATDISGEEIGLFRYLATNGTIQNLTLDNFTLSGGSSSSNKIGAFVAVMNGGTISNCQLSNSSISCLQNTQNPTVGGIVGQLFAGSVTDCIVDGSSIKAQTSDEGASGANANAGGIVGALTGDTISGCQVKGATAVLADYADHGSAAAGAIVANNNGGTLANNTYEYTVTVTEKSTAKSGYEQRGIGGTTYNSETEADESIPDITTNNGAVMYTQKLTIVGLGDNCGIEGVGGYEPLADPENHIYYFAPGQETTFYLYPDATYEASVALTYSETSTTISKDAEEDSYKFTMPDVEATLNVTLTAKQSIWIGGIEVEVSEGVFPDVEGAAYDAETNTLTLTDFEFTQREGAAIEFGIEGLKVHLVGENTITCHDQSGAAFKSLVADNTITFSAEDDESRLTMATLTPYSNLTASYNGKLVYIANGDYKYVMPIEAPYLGVSDGILMMNAELLPEGAQCFYAIDYADETLTDVDMTEATAVESFFEGPEILGPCTVTSYMKAGTAQSSTATGKYFGFATSELNVPLGTSEVDLPAIVPAMGDDVEVGYEGNVSEGKINLSNTTIGKNATQVMASFSSLLDVMPFTILNDYANLTVNVLPPAPTIVFDETKEYLNTDVVSITLPETLAEYENAVIMYSWVEDCPDGNGTTYTDNSKVTLTAGTGTLYAWVRYNSGTSADDALYSERVSQVFTVKTDINTVSVGDFSQTATYTGSAIVPKITVYDSEKTQNVLDAANYELTFQQMVDDEPVDVEEMVNVGTYIITLVGKDTYGSSMVIAEAFEVTKANPVVTAPTAVADLTYNGENQTLVEAGTTSTGTTMMYKLGANEPYTETLPVGKNAGNYIVYYMVSGGDNYNNFESETTVQVTIAKKVLTEDMVTLSAETFAYNGETQKPAVTVSDGEALKVDDYTVTNEGGTEVGTYEVTVTATEGGNYTGSVTKTFTIDNRTLEVGKDVTFADGQTWASLYITTESLNLPEGIMAYIVTGVSSTTATLKAINYVPKNVPVFLENNSEMTTDNTSADGNLLSGTHEDTAVSGINGTVYGLHNNKLIKVTSGSIPAGRAYLVTGVVAGAPQLLFDFGNGVTGISNMMAETEDADGEGWYTVDGRKLQQKPAQKGLYIKNGRKVVINKK